MPRQSNEPKDKLSCFGRCTTLHGTFLHQLAILISKSSREKDHLYHTQHLLSFCNPRSTQLQTFAFSWSKLTNSDHYQPLRGFSQTFFQDHRIELMSSEIFESAGLIRHHLSLGSPLRLSEDQPFSSPVFSWKVLPIYSLEVNNSSALLTEGYQLLFSSQLQFQISTSPYHH
ncbi:hypothetical protein FGO68_gene9151 [Halteria grandinella]|uniref:Uncharacterized protein n=1 Tax=Halteria grandinella TaxID=5974 RepID=A0A8J8P1J6_HALGN|nr:hypothetical protein FGO68_gene9151 [Halteria grandinella]